LARAQPSSLLGGRSPLRGLGRGEHLGRGRLHVHDGGGRAGILRRPFLKGGERVREKEKEKERERERERERDNASFLKEIRYDFSFKKKEKDVIK
jgi:hypothetical protein